MNVEAPGDDLKAAAESVLGAGVRVAGRLDFGNVNRVYRVEAGGRAYALKVFRHGDWPEPGKLPWVESQLALRGVPRARLVHYTRDAAHFPHGFSLSEFVEGENCKGLIRAGRLAPAAFCEMAGSYLRRVHEVSVPRYGYLGAGEGMYDDFVGWYLACEVEDKLREMGDPSAEALYPLVERAVEPVLRRHESRFVPVLIHGDCMPKNGLLGEGGGFALVDWDEAVAAFWVMDYAALTYWYAYTFDGGGAREPDVIRDAFFRGYGEHGFDPDELREIELAFHTAQAAGVLWYLHKTGDGRGAARTRELLLHLLDTTHARRGRG